MNGCEEMKISVIPDAFVRSSFFYCYLKDELAMIGSIR